MVLTFVSPPTHVIAASQPLMRVLVLEASRLRMRADGRNLLFLSGIGYGAEKVRAFDAVKNKDGKIQLLLEGSSLQKIILGRNSELRVKSYGQRGIWLGKRRYRGELRLRLNKNTLQVVNHLDLEEYLASVVGAEMPKSWPMAALKAQAVAARTYALKKIGKSGPYDIKSSALNQVYLGVESETSTTKRAVRSTRSLVLVHEGKLISAVFHSSSGGVTEASGDVWKYQLPYLVSVKDHDSHSPAIKWNLRFEPKKLRVIFKEIGGFKSIKTLRVSPTGRLREASVVGPSGELIITGQELRQRLGLKSTLVSFEIIPVKPSPINYSDSPFIGFYQSNVSETIDNAKSFEKENALFFMKSWRNDDLLRLNPGIRVPILSPPLPHLVLKLPPPLPPVDESGKQFSLIVRGLGAGHGVGMSQWGANGLAKKGLDFREILSYYYKNVDIISLRRLKNLSFGFFKNLVST